MSQVKPQTLYLESYGCQMNEADAEVMLRRMLDSGYTRVPEPDGADVVLINTCAVREHAETRVLGRLSQLACLKLRRPDQVLGLTGCMAQHLKARLLEKAPYLDLVIGPDGYRRLPELVDQARTERLVEVRLDRDETYADIVPVRGEGVRAWITIMRGCDKFCTFCIVPYVRGRERSLAAEEILAQVRHCEERGYKEVVLLGQTVNSYRHGDTDFAALLRMVNAVDGIERIRFTSPYPTDTTDAVIDAMASCEKVCPSIHFPLQSASNHVLEKMRREYTIEEYDAILSKLRAAVPGIGVSTDIIVGFPGETAADYQQTYDYMQSVRYDSAFMFKYSPREGARAWGWEETVGEDDKADRLQRIIDLQEQISAEVNRERLGRTVSVLVEGEARRGEGNLYGKTPDFKTVVFPAAGARSGQTVNVEVEETTAHSLFGIAVA